MFWRLYVPLFLLGIGVWYVWDTSSRNGFGFQCPNSDEVRIFNNDTTSDIRAHYQKFFHQDKFRFPRSRVLKTTLRRNILFFSTLTEHSLSDTSQKALIDFLNNPENFSWQHTGLLHSQTDYIIYFHDEKQQLIGKLWLCTSCRSLIAIPFSPNMKFGHVKKDKWPVLKKIIGIE